MKTNFTYKLDDLLRISGQSTHDFPIAKKAAEEILAFIESQSEIINSYKNLEKVVSKSGISEMEDALTAINHVSSSLEQLVDMNKKGDIDDFSDIQQKVAALKDKSISSFKNLSQHKYC